MRILSITLRNFKSHGDAHLTFERGTNAICGENGAGKTSVLEGIAWVLFDHNPYGTQEDLIRTGAPSAEVAVQVISAYDDRTYEIRRHTGRGYQILDPQLGHRLEYERKTEVLTWLRQHLGVPAGTDLAKLFSTTVGVPQGTFTADFLKSPRDRKQVFDRILKVEEYQQVFKDLLKLENFSKEQVTQIKHHIEKLLVELREWDELQTERERLQQEIQECQTGLERCQKSLVERGRQLAEWEATAEILRQLEGQIQKADHDRALQHMQVTQAQEALQTAQTAQAQVEEHRSAFHAYQTAEHRLRDLEQAFQERQRLLGQRDQHREQHQESHTQITRLQEKLQRLDQAAQQQVALQPQIAEQERLEQREQELKDLAEQWIQHQQHLQVIETRLGSTQEQCQRAEQALQEAEQAQQHCQADLQDYQQYLQAEEKIGQLEQGLQDQQQLQQQRQQIQDRIHHLQVQQAKLGQQRDQFAQLQQEIQSLRPQIQQQEKWETKQKDLQTKLAHFEAMRVQLEHQQAEQNQIQARLQDLQAQIQDYRGYQEHVDQIPELEEKLDRIGSQLSRIAAARQFQQELETALSQGHQGLTQQAQKVQEVLRVLEQIRRDFPQLSSQLSSVPSVLTQGTALMHEILQQIDQMVQDISHQVCPETLQTQQRQIRERLQQSYQARIWVDQLPQLHQEHGKLQDRTQQVQDAIDDLLWDLEAEETYHRQLSETTTQLQTLADPRAQLQVQQQRLQDQSQVEQQWQQIQLEINQQCHQIQELEQQLQVSNSLQHQLSDYRQQQQHHRTAYLRYLQSEPLAKTLSHRQREQQQIHTQLHQIQKDLNQQQQQIQHLQTQAGTAAQITTARSEIAQQLQKLRDPRGQSYRLQEEINTRPDLERSYQQLQQQLNTYQSQLQQITQELTRTDHVDEEIRKQQQIRDTHRAAHQLYLNAYPIAETLTDRQQTLHRSQAQLHQVTQIFQELQAQKQTTSETYDLENHQQLQQAQKEEEIEQARLQTRIQNLIPQLETVKQKLEHLTQLREEQTQIETDLKERERLHRFIKFSREVFKKAGPKITALYLENVNWVADQLFREILNRPTLSLTWEADYDIVIQEGAGRRRFASLSGGEQMAAALAVRLALLKVLGELDVAFFDEPTTNMDRQRRQRLAEAITHVRSFEQLFVISHDDTFEHITENVIYLERGERNHGD